MKNILIVIDVQRGFIVNEMTEEALHRINKLLSADLFDAVAGSKYQSFPDNPIVRLMGWSKLMQEEQQTLLGKINEIPMYTVEKTTYSAAVPALFDWLKKQGGGAYPDCVFLVGVDTECCVLSTAIDLFEAGIRPVVLSDYCGSSGGEEYHAAGIMSLHHLIGKNNIYAGSVESRAELEQARSAAADTAQNDNGSVGRETEAVRWLVAHHKHISFAESCTGGLCAGCLVNVPDASRVLNASFVTYANEAKIKYVGVSAQTIEKYGVVSEQVAGEMAIGTAAANGAEVGVGISGIAGPTGATATKPIGMVCFGFAIDGRVFTYTRYFGNAGRNSVRRMSVEFVFQKLCELFAQTE